MRELTEDLFYLTDEFDAICITTNAIVKKDGRAVMGGGCALECAKRWPETPAILGDLLLTAQRNIPFQLGVVGAQGIFSASVNVEDDELKAVCRVFSFPTKNHYKDKSDLGLIKESCRYMIEFANLLGMEYIAIPRPGAGLGGLDWKTDVKPAIKDMLDDRFHILHQEGK